MVFERRADCEGLALCVATASIDVGAGAFEVPFFENGEWTYSIVTSATISVTPPHNGQGDHIDLSPGRRFMFRGFGYSRIDQQVSVSAPPPPPFPGLEARRLIGAASRCETPPTYALVGLRGTQTNVLETFYHLPVTVDVQALGHVVGIMNEADGVWPDRWAVYMRTNRATVDELVASLPNLERRRGQVRWQNRSQNIRSDTDIGRFIEAGRHSYNFVEKDYGATNVHTNHVVRVTIWGDDFAVVTCQAAAN